MAELFPTEFETERLAFERVSPEHTDLFEVHNLATTNRWDRVTEWMPWYDFNRLDRAKEYVKLQAEQWDQGEKASYTIRPKAGEPRAGDLIGFTALGPEWETRRAGCGVEDDPAVWGNGYAYERALEMVRLTFEHLQLDAYYTTCAAGNDRSRRMIERYVEHFGGRHEGLLRQHSSRPNGEVTDQHRFTITRAEYEAAVDDD
jgi:RimJ/RimL family protein N-acetyltransferase